MKNKYKAVEAPIKSDIICDNKSCNYVMPGVDHTLFVLMIDQPCPKCGENLLTEKDYKHHKALLKVIKFINILFFPYMFIRGGRKDKDSSTISYHHHDGKTTMRNENGETIT